MFLLFKISSVKEILKILKRETGLITSLQIMFRLLVAHLFKNLWKKLPAAIDRNEHLSRMMLGPLILLYQILKIKVPADRVLKISGQVIIQLSTMFMARQIPAINSQKLNKMAEFAKKKYILNISSKFFNARISDVKITSKTFNYKINHCHFNSLLNQIDCSELACFFCRADFSYFEQEQQNILFKRGKNLVDGDDCCDFQFTLKDLD